MSIGWKINDERIFQGMNVCKASAYVSLVLQAANTMAPSSTEVG